MCTAVSFSQGDHYFGRNLDLEYGYREQVIVTPRHFPLSFRRMPQLRAHSALIGMGTVVDGYPLYYEATNEHGLSMAGLYFPGGRYGPFLPDRDNLASFELIPWVLGRCTSVAEARKLLVQVNLTDDAFRPDFPPQPLHWLLADRSQAIAVEPEFPELGLYEDPAGVLTNAPGLPFQLQYLADCQNLRTDAPLRAGEMPVMPFYSVGMGAIGLPGDFSSVSRFLKATFVTHNSRTDGTEHGNVNQFFRILQSVSMPRGCVQAENGDPVITRYSCCCNTDRGIYYYTTYENCRITAIHLHGHDLSADALTCWSLRSTLDLLPENENRAPGN